MRRVLALGLALIAFGCFQIAGYDEFSFRQPFRVRLLGERIERMDVLFVVDESRGTLQRQELLADTLRLFLGRLLNPRCVDADGREQEPPPDGPLEECAPGHGREFQVVPDVHLGVITTSLGGHGSDACTNEPVENRKAHLVDGVLAWDATGKSGQSDPDALANDLADVISSLGAEGCGFEAQHEAWYRFLVEPEPHDEVVLEGDPPAATPVGTDEALLEQRKAYLRDDSLVVIVLISDENDCSIRDGGHHYLAALIQEPGTGNPYHLPPPTAACAVDPNDPCCTSCSLEPPPGCDTSMDACAPSLPALEDHVNVRCFDQKRRFGIDFLQPIERYVVGLTERLVSNRAGELVPNPLLLTRDPSQVVLSAIVGVPWQDIARRDAEGKPDLRSGEDAAGAPVGGFMSAAELAATDPRLGMDAWTLVLGDPGAGVDPADPHMIPSIDVRTGTHPLTGTEIAPPGSEAWADPIHSHEWEIETRDDLQSACLHPLVQPIDCTTPACDCASGADDDPVCQDPRTDLYGTVQHFGRATPGVRHLQILKEIGPQGVLGSVCPAQVNDASAADYGYRAAIFGAIIEKLTPKLRSQLCLRRGPVPGADGTVPCTLVEARRVEEGSCRCDAEDARVPLTEAERGIVEAARADPLFATEQWNCYCAVPQATGVDRDACRSRIDEPVINEFGYPVDRWCHVDAQAPAAAALSAACPPDKPELVRLLGKARAAPDATLFLDCR